MKKKLGIIGGLGPMASAQFLSLLTALTDAKRDQEHIEAILYSRPDTPDRTACLLGQSTESPLPNLLDTGKCLEQMGAKVLAIPCMTAYGFYDVMAETFSAELLHPIRETARVLSAHGIRTAGIMATDGTLQAGLFQAALEAEGIHCVVPMPKHQRIVMRMIYDQVKCGQPVSLRSFHAVANGLRQQGAERVILGCTELSVVQQQQAIGEGYLDAMAVLATSAIRACGYSVRPDYRLL